MTDHQKHLFIVGITALISVKHGIEIAYVPGMGSLLELAESLGMTLAEINQGISDFTHGMIQPNIKTALPPMSGDANDILKDMRKEKGESNNDNDEQKG